MGRGVPVTHVGVGEFTTLLAPDDQIVDCLSDPLRFCVCKIQPGHPGMAIQESRRTENGNALDLCTVAANGTAFSALQSSVDEPLKLRRLCRVAGSQVVRKEILCPRWLCHGSLVAGSSCDHQRAAFHSTWKEPVGAEICCHTSS